MGMFALEPNADRLGCLYSELSILLQSEEDAGPGLIALMNEYGSEDVKWTLTVLSEDMGVNLQA